MRRSKGFMSTHTQKLKGRARPTPSDFIREFSFQSRVLILPRPYREGMPSLRYDARHGVIVGKRGSSYIVEIQDGRKKKKLIVHPVHLVSATNW